MDAQKLTIVTQIMASYIRIKDEMEQTYNKRIQDLITQKQICGNKINNLYHQQLQNAIDTIQNITTKNTNNLNREPITHTRVQQSSKHNNNGINLLLQAHEQLKNVPILKEDSNILSSKNNRENISNINNETANICSYCSKHFTRRSLLKRHVELAHIADIHNYAVNVQTTNRRANKTNTSNESTGNNISNDRLKNHLQKKHHNKLKKKQSANNDFDFEPSELSESSCSQPKYRSTSRIRARCSNTSRLDSDNNGDDSDNNGDGSDLSDEELEKLKKKIDEMNKNDLKCPICQKIGRDKYTLKYHLVVHTKKKPFKCCWCKKRYKRDCSLKLHQKESCEFRYTNVSIGNHNTNNAENKKRKKILKKKSSKKIHSAGKRRRNPKHDEVVELPPLKKSKKSEGKTSKGNNKDAVRNIEEDYVSMRDSDDSTSKAQSESESGSDY
eukprot:115138_1